MKKPPTLNQILSREFLEEHALPSNINYGTAIFRRRAVVIIASSDTRIEARVGGLDGKVVEGGGSRRRVEFTTSESGFRWKCTGNPKHHQIFCKHCVALALEVLSQKND